MNVLDGLYRPRRGGSSSSAGRWNSARPRDAIAAGGGMVHQHFALVPTQTVTENVLIGLDRPRFRVDLGATTTRSPTWPAATAGGRPAVARLAALRRGAVRVSILKMLYRGARILILDEPTAVLAPQEAADLFRTLRSMVAGGASVVFISHKLGEVSQIADRVTVMRRGRATAAGIPIADTTTAGLARLMVGREVVEAIERTPFAPGPVVLHMQDVRAQSDRGLPALRGISLEVRSARSWGSTAWPATASRSWPRSSPASVAARRAP